ncbi:MAG: GGDEF-domain containing protein, partial [Xanthobacteraceae bacterium]
MSDNATRDPSRSAAAHPPGGAGTGFAAVGPNATEILASVGEALYCWDIGSDVLLWSANAGEVLRLADLDTIATGRAYAALLEADNVQSRFDAVIKSDLRDEGRGVHYHVQYCLRPGANAEAKLWVEDTGRWFAGPDGKPARAHGTVRVINERYERERRLNYLARYDDLTGELNRYH